MRKSIADDLEAYRRHHDRKYLQRGRHQLDEIAPTNKKIIEIIVQKAIGLTIHDGPNRVHQMTPFYSYGFYTFEHTSATLTGNNPEFDDHKKFEVEYKAEF